MQVVLLWFLVAHGYTHFGYSILPGIWLFFYSSCLCGQISSILPGKRFSFGVLNILSCYINVEDAISFFLLPWTPLKNYHLFNFLVYFVLLVTRSPVIEPELIWKKKDTRPMLYKSCWIRISIIFRKMRLFNELSDRKIHTQRSI